MTLEKVVALAGEDPNVPRDRLRQLIANLKVAAIVADDNARIVLVNPAASTLTGYAEQELLRLSVYDITGQRDAENMDALWRVFVRLRRQSGRYQIQTRDGGGVQVDYVAVGGIVPGLHLSLLRRVSRRAAGTA